MINFDFEKLAKGAVLVIASLLGIIAALLMLLFGGCDLLPPYEPSEHHEYSSGFGPDQSNQCGDVCIECHTDKGGKRDGN